LAKNLILLSGLQPDKDIDINFTGVRPGEKLYEELHLFEESTVPTRHDKIKMFTGQSLSYAEVREHITLLRRICAARDATQLVLQLKDIVPEYNPSTDLLRRVMNLRSSTVARRAQVAAVG
jgi:FlaA1/EpsC-like NDP-sugar epimerase